MSAYSLRVVMIGVCGDASTFPLHEFVYKCMHNTSQRKVQENVQTSAAYVLFYSKMVDCTVPT